MNASPSRTHESASTAPTELEREQLLAELDQSGRWPLLVLLTGALLWLVLGSAGLLLSSIKLHAPGMLASAAWLTYGRLYPASLNALLYGFASQAGIAVALWMLSRLGRAPVALPVFTIIAAKFWNLGVLIGIAGILLGDTTGFAWFEMPGYASPILFFAYALVGAAVLMTFAGRQEKALYVSHWYLLAALFWFPWVYSVAQVLLVFHPLRGAVQAAVHGWAVNGLFTLWLTPLGLATVFYFIPKITERPLYSESLAKFGFWTLAFVGVWVGLTPSMPLPAGVVSMSVAAGVVMIIPLVSVAVNWQQTLLGQTAKIKASPPLRFIGVAASSYVLAAALGVLGSMRSVSRLTEFTFLYPLQQYLLLLGLVGMAVAGAAYYFVPKLAQLDFPCSLSKAVHWWGSVAGLGCLTVGLLGAGLVQGIGLNNSAKPILEVARSIQPWLHVTALGLTLYVIAQSAFLFNLTYLVAKKSRQCMVDRVAPELRTAPAVSIKVPSHTERREQSRRVEVRPQPRPPAPSKPGQGKKRRKR